MGAAAGRPPTKHNPGMTKIAAVQMVSSPEWEINRDRAAALVAACVAAAPAARFVLVSALGVGDSLDCLPYASHDVLKPWLERKALAEQSLEASGLEWTVLRPGPLTDAPPSGRAVATLDATQGARGGIDRPKCRLIRRADARSMSRLRQARRSARWRAATWRRWRTRRACLAPRAAARSRCWTAARSSLRRPSCASWRPGKAPPLTNSHSEIMRGGKDARARK